MDPHDEPGGDRRETWTAYAYLSAFGFLLYGIGALTPYLRDELRLTDTAAALHSTAVALGLVSAGWLADAVERRVGRRAAGRLASGLLGAAAVLLALGPALPVTLLAAYLAGAGGGAILSTVNLVLGHRGGPRAATNLARANVWAIGAAFLAPFSIAALATTALGWRAALVPPLVALALLELRGGQTLEAAPAAAGRARLPAGFWVAWLFVVLAVAIEFSYVVWGSSIVERRTGSAREAATAIAGLFLTGMLGGRLALATGLVRRVGTGRWIEGSLLLVAAAGVVVWLAGDPAASGAGFAVAGLGTAALYPLAIPAALARAREAVLAAGARMTLASGLAILVAPLVLGVVSDAVGVVDGWPLVIGLCGVAFLVHRALPALPGAASEAPGPAPTVS